MRVATSEAEDDGMSHSHNTFVRPSTLATMSSRDLSERAAWRASVRPKRQSQGASVSIRWLLPRRKLQFSQQQALRPVR